MHDFDIIKQLLHGWIGPMCHVRKEDKDFRLYDIRGMRSSLREDLELRIQMMKDFENPNLPALQFYNEDTILTSYSESVSVEQLIEDGDIWPTTVFQYFTQEVLSLLTWAHNKGIIHGDLHPGLIYISRSGEVYIEGFGRTASRAEHPHTAHHRYLPPEPFGSVAGDLYAFGVILIELLLQRHVSLGDILPETHIRKVQGLIAECDHKDPQMIQMIQKALQFDPENRKECLLLFFDSDVDQNMMWKEFCSHLDVAAFFEEDEHTDPMDVVFHTDASTDMFVPSQAELNMNELTEDILPPEPFEISSSPPSLVEKKGVSSQLWIVLALVMVVVGIILTIIL